ncbi:MAG: hypothetical protein E6G99_12510 [Bacillati bacterium ANGP1]|uniref:Vitamin K epoxide reductase domain-containing protein n=1 Tax=Candidatus Segetimicrobium genomatis TaxID=2569760 RepID=A0A537L1H3_9BACT|nr:MAG: hypothetical protein E6G99_12510 [Terrabacteria group bacterium ANGP1]TMJ11997.1 MAG: hypothetical protein E6G98_03970 [Terrabacteria group bacterium ANGP1]
MIPIVWLGLAGVAISAYVWYTHVTDGPVVCLGSGCATVIRSEYGRLLSIPNGALGVLYFGLVALTPLLERSLLPEARSLMLIPTSIALVLYLYLTYLQFFVLQAVCNWCLMSAGLTLLIFGVLIFR